jgi:ParB family chromosome partitioning protein
MGGAPQSELTELPVETIHPNPRQPRQRHDAEAAHGLADSVRTQGVIQPVLVRRRHAGGFELIAGERRWRAAREAGLAMVPALVRDADDRDTLLLALVENVAREQLSPVEEARACALLIDEFSLSLGEVSERVGRSKPSVSNKMRLLELPDDVLSMVERAELSEGHARAVLAVPDQDGRRRLAREIVKTGMSVRAAEQKARWAGARQSHERRVRQQSIQPLRSASARQRSGSRACRCVSRAAGSRSSSPTSTSSPSLPNHSNGSGLRRNRKGCRLVAPVWADSGLRTLNRSSASRRMRSPVVSCCGLRNSPARAGSSHS